MYSTFKKPGWKSEQLENLVPILKRSNLFVYGYGIRRLHTSRLKKVKASIIPLVASRSVNALARAFRLPDYLGYLVGEFVFGLKYARQVSKDESKIVYVKSRPHSIVKRCKDYSKFVVVEHGELHPLENLTLMEKEYQKLGAIPHRSKYIYQSKYASSQALKSLELADKIVVLSNRSKESMVKYGIPADKVEVVGLGLPFLPNRISDFQDDFHFVTTAHHSIVKGTHHLLIAWKSVNSKGKKLYVVGRISQELREFIFRNGPFENVEFVGEQAIGEFYSGKSFVGILTSISEGYGRSVVEYLGYSYPVIVSPVATCDFVVDTKNGFIVDSHEGLVKSLEYFVNNPSDYARMSDYAFRSAVEASKLSFGKRMVDILEGLNEN